MESIKLVHLLAITILHVFVLKCIAAACFPSTPYPKVGAVFSLRHTALGYCTTERLRPCRYRVGIGYDIHRLVKSGQEGKPFKLGGVLIPDSTVNVIGHSDADVMLHALADAILGAAGCGDIGEHFPDKKASLANMDSKIILQLALQEAYNVGYQPRNVDIIVVIQNPRLGRELKRQICASLSNLLGSNTLVSVKAKTNEGLDALGRGEAVACHVVILLEHI
ncbi:2-C-methyl-D-erythritol 2 [Babesia sp. Xinjiang]|uniref:2-C-methyl-D-erythritol 2 n=1 Tax=Babesia sp. Xinjiang TaxID=462227 RepID=UPI000A25F366|nr:2-C-methyl-D-erythritol 2 [Babesia sp. Xinjiang]ORM41365.1 2-C-methyl-D-erythritol 2 [Babesia sp. Xinjiang]